MVLLLLIPEKKRRESCISYTCISHSSGVWGGEGLSIRAKALSVEIAVTDDMFLYVTGDCRWRIIRSDGCFALLKGSRRIFFSFLGGSN